MPKQPTSQKGVPLKLHFGGINFEIKLLVFVRMDVGCKDNTSGTMSSAKTNTQRDRLWNGNVREPSGEPRNDFTLRFRHGESFL